MMASQRIKQNNYKTWSQGLPKIKKKKQKNKN